MHVYSERGGKTMVRTKEDIEKVMNTYGDMVFKLAFSIIKDYASAEDIAQNVFIKYMQTEKEFCDLEHQKAWLLRTAINECKMHLRYYWNAKRVVFPEGWEIVHNDEVHEEFLLDIVMSLPRKYREAIHLYYYEELSIKEIAVILKKKEATVKTNLHRGKQLLKRRLEEIGYER